MTTDWDSLLPADDVKVSVTNWTNKFMKIMFQNKRESVPWLTKATLPWAYMAADKNHLHNHDTVEVCLQLLGKILSDFYL